MNPACSGASPEHIPPLEAGGKPSGPPIGLPNHGARNTDGSETTRSLDPGLRATHDQ